MVFGGELLDVTTIDLAVTRLGGALPDTSEVRDVDFDGHDDLVLEMAVEDMAFSPLAEILHFGGFTTDGMWVARSRVVTVAVTDPDFDGDGIHDACDLCPSNGAAPRSPGGCPW